MTSSNRLDWSQLYTSKQIALWQLPSASQDNPEEGVFRQLFLSWSKLPEQTPRGDDIPLWFLCCDVLDLDKDIVTGTTALVFARRIEITGTASLIFDRSEGNTQDIIIFAQEVIDKTTGQPTTLNVTTVGDDEVIKTYPFQPDPNKRGASGFFWADRAEKPKVMKPAELEPAYLYEGEPLRLVLVTIFQLATLLSTENLDLSVSQFRWVSGLAQSSPETQDLAVQAHSTAMTLLSMKAAGEDALLVPQLDLDIYSEKAKAFMDLLRDRQRQWDNFRSRLAEDKHWVDAAKDAIATQQNQKNLADKLVNQAEKTRRQVLYARDIAAKQISAEKALIAERKIDFDRGIATWKEQQTIEASIDLVVGVVKMLGQIPAIVAAGPQMAVLPAVETAAGLVENAANIVNSVMSSGEKKVEEVEMQALGPDGKAIANAPADKSQRAEFIDKQAQKERKEAQDALKEGLNTAREGGQEFFNAVMKVVEISQTAEQMESQSRAALNSVNDAATNAFSSYEVQGLDVVTGGEQVWDLLLVAIEHTFENISDLKDVGGGTDYRLEIRRLVIYGRALNQARLAMAKANAELAEMKWRRIAAEKAIAIAESRLDKLGDQIAHDETFAQLVFGRILDAKRSVYLAMEAYHRAFQYFALVDEAQAPRLPKITDTADKFGSAIANISGRELELTALGQPPQTMNRTVYLDSAELLKQLKSNKFISWELSSDDIAFRGFGRVRFNRVRVFVEGLQSSSEIKVQIATSGVYVDKIPGGGTRTFVGEVTRRNFIYNGADQSIVFDGDIASRYKDDFFIPTPFTIWTLKIGRQDDNDIDLSSITRLKVEFHGEATSPLTFNR